MGMIYKYGKNGDVDAAEDVWTPGGDYAFPSAAAATVIVSDDINDDGDVASTGARTVTVEGLLADYVYHKETITMDGTTDVDLSQFLRVFRAYVATAGSSGANEGTIQIKHGATVLCQIDPLVGQSLMAIVTTPAGAWSNLMGWWAELDRATSASATLALMMSTNGGPWLQKEVRSVTNISPMAREYPVSKDSEGFRIPPKTDIKLRVLSVSVANLIMYGGFDYDVMGAQ